MEPSSFNSIELLRCISAKNLYDKLLLQLEKDARLANIPIEITAGLQPKELVKTLHSQIENLLQTNTSALSNLMYTADIAEKDLRKLEGLDTEMYAANVCYLLLKRLWKKVWIKEKYSNP